MVIAKVKITDVRATTIMALKIPKGIIGATVELEFTGPAWDNLIKNVVFVGSKEVMILDVANEVPLPTEVVNAENIVVRIGICGVDAENNVAIPTLWADLGTVKPATPMDVGYNPQLPVWAQLQQQINVMKGNSRIVEIDLPASKWSGGGSFYRQIVTVDGVTQNSQVDLKPDAEQLLIFYDKSLALVAENEGGVVTVYAIGQKPENDYTIQAAITEVHA